MTPLTITGFCPACGARLAPWEESCGCRGPRWPSNVQVLYAVACQTGEPLHARDFIRHAEGDFRSYMDQATAITVMSSDRRFCWAGRGLYGLYRHGLMPGPRNLEQAARMLLVAAGRPLAPDTVEFCLKRMGYRFNAASLRNAVNRSPAVSLSYGLWDHDRSTAAQLSLTRDLTVLPQHRLAAWDWLRDGIADRINSEVAVLEVRLGALADPRRFGLDWQG